MRRMAIALLVLALTAALAPVRSAAANDNWPHFRGPTLNAAVADNPNLPEQWSSTENVEWVTDIPGLGWSSPVVWGQRVFLTTVTAVGDFELPKPGLYAPNGRPDPARWSTTGGSTASPSRPAPSCGSTRSGTAGRTFPAT